MKTVLSMGVIIILGCAGCRSPRMDAGQGGDAATTREVPGPPDGQELPGIGDAPDVVPADQSIAVQDPLEPVNRAFFLFNDKLYFWVLKPVSKGYARAVPQQARLGVKNFFSNIAMPARFVNCALQAQFQGAWVELERFAINTTIGMAGFCDPAKNKWNLSKRDEDLGQTLGWYGIGPSMYIDFPILGPTCARDTVGFLGDRFLDPINYLVPKTLGNAGVKSFDTINGASLRPGEYEEFKRTAIDPYSALRDAYYQYRRQLIKNEAKKDESPAGAMPEK